MPKTKQQKRETAVGLYKQALSRHNDGPERSAELRQRKTSNLQTLITSTEEAIKRGR